MPYTVKAAKKGRDGRVIYWGVYHEGRLAAQVVRSKAEAATIARRLNAIRRARKAKR